MSASRSQAAARLEPDDAVAEAPAAPARPLSARKTPGVEKMLPKGRLFLTEHVIKRGLTPQARHLTIPTDAIISPLAEDWLVLNGIKIVRE